MDQVHPIVYSLLMLLMLCWPMVKADVEVNFELSSVTVNADENITFNCSGTTGIVELTYRDRTYSGNKTLSLNITASYMDDDEVATCKDGNITRKVVISVLYPPIFTSSFVYEVVIGQEATTVIRFQSNPVANVVQIINQNGTLMRNYYMLREEKHQTLVFHFLKVEEDDVGNYTLNLFGPDTSYNFRLRAVQESFEQSDLQTFRLLLIILIPVTVVLACLVIVAVVCCYRKKVSSLQVHQPKAKPNDYAKASSASTEAYIKANNNRSRPGANLASPTNQRLNINMTSLDAPPPISQRTTSLHKNHPDMANFQPASDDYEYDDYEQEYQDTEFQQQEQFNRAVGGHHPMQNNIRNFPVDAGRVSGEAGGMSATGRQHSYQNNGNRFAGYKQPQDPDDELYEDF
ncbi:uncharacterized protein LOC143448564 [Clavelina lepadiformis]|uniref:uncharacterized protein LOC143448564 n=1 Tax=Clavelina lepadiformis TaxID=159417 RepID=UPI0040412614